MKDLIKLLKSLGLEAPDKPEDLTDEQIAEARAAVRKAGLEAVEAKDKAKASELSEANKALTEIADTRAAEASELAGLADEFAEPEAEAEEVVEEEPEAEPEAEADPEPEVEAEEKVEPPKVEKQEKIAATVKRKTPVAPKTPTGNSLAGVTVRAAAGFGDLAQGAPIPTPDVLSRGFAIKAEVGLRSPSGSQANIAKGTVSYPESRYLGDSRRQNLERIDAAVPEMQSRTREALREIAGMKDPYEVIRAALACNPAAVNYDVLGLGSRVRPIRDALNRFGADRGGVEFMTPYSLADVVTSGGGAGVGTWLNDDDDPGDKTCQPVDCGDFITESVDALYACMDLTNFNARYFTESGRAFWNLILTAHARVAESRLWDRLTALATASLTVGQSLGTFRDVVEALVRNAEFMRSTHREPDLPVRYVVDSQVASAAAMDLFRQMPGDDMTEVTKAKLTRTLAGHNIAITFSPDVDVAPAGADGALPAWPSSVEALGFFEGTLAFLDGGEWNFGMDIRDSALNAQNRVRAMIETAEGVANFGVDLRLLTIETCPSGETAGTVDAAVCAPAS